MARKTVLNASHHALGARMVDFGGWDMPIHYGSQLEEHHAVRLDVGMFDVSHMSVLDLTGARTRDFLCYLLANNIGKLKVHGKALYSCMLNELGGVIDDLICYFLDDHYYRLVVNAATRDKDLAWIKKQALAFDVAVRERRDLAIIAVQGPYARHNLMQLLVSGNCSKIEQLGRFFSVTVPGPQGMDLFVARTGYTGEDGVEIMLPGDDALILWEKLAALGVRPVGLGARDTLRLEAGMNLYGQDMDESVSPWEAGLSWTVSLDNGRDFIGRAALEKQKAVGVERMMVGLVLDEKGVLRPGQTVLTACGEGKILSGSFAPTLERAIALARIPVGESGDICVEIRGRKLPVRRVNYPFVRDGKACAGVC